MKNGMQWPIGVIAILGITVVANIALMRAANDDPSFAVEDNYYERGVQFDTTMAQERQNQALGWTALSTIAGAPHGRATLRVHLTDKRGQALAADSVSVVALFIARANDHVAARLTPDAAIAGDYVADIPMTRPGQWEVRVDARKGADRFVTTTRAVATNVAANTVAPADTPAK